jgi:hypothetical protein
VGPERFLHHLLISLKTVTEYLFYSSKSKDVSQKSKRNLDLFMFRCCLSVENNPPNSLYSAVLTQRPAASFATGIKEFGLQMEETGLIAGFSVTISR